MARFLGIFLLCLCYSWPLFANNELSQVYQNAVKEYNLKNYPQVISDLKRYLAAADSQGHLFPEAIFLLGQAYEEERSYPLALEYYQTFIRNYPDHGKISDVLLALGKLYYDQREYANAQAVFQKIYTDYPTTFQAVEALRLESQCLLALNKLDEAEVVITNLLKKYPRHEVTQQSLYTLGKTWLETGAYPQARKTFLLLLELDPPPESAASAYYGLAWTSYREGINKMKLPEIYQNLNKVVTEYPQSSYAPQSLFLHAEIAREQGDEMLAIAKYKLLIENYPQSESRVEAMYNLAKIYQKKGQNSLTNLILQELSDEYPQHRLAANAFLMLGQMAQERGDYPGAIEYYIHIINQATNLLNPTAAKTWKPFFRLASENFLNCVKNFNDQEFSIDAYFLLAEASQKLGDYNSALQYYLLALQLLTPADERYDKAQIGLASIYLQKKETSQARQIYELLLAKATTPANIIPLTVNAARSYYLENNETKAVELLEGLVQKYPEQLEISFVHYWLGQINFHRQDYKRAIDNFNASLQVKNQQEVVLPEVQYKLGYANYREKNYIEALRVLETLLQRFPDAQENQKASFLVANIQYDLGNYPQAAAYYLKLTNLFPDSPIAPLAQYRLGAIALITQKYPEAALEFNQFLVVYGKEELARNARLALAFSFFLAEDWPGARGNLQKFILSYPEDGLIEEALFLLFLEAQSSQDYAAAFKYLQELETSFPESQYQFEIKIIQADFQVANSIAILKELSVRDFHSETASVFQENTQEARQSLQPFAEMLHVTMNQLKEKHLKKIQEFIIGLPLNESQYY